MTGFPRGEKLESAATVHNSKCQQPLETQVSGAATSCNGRRPLGPKHLAPQEAPEVPGGRGCAGVPPSGLSGALGGAGSSPSLCKNCLHFAVSRVTRVYEVAASDLQLDLSYVVTLASHVGRSLLLGRHVQP
ncbi:hypothetical protein HJG60_007762 [Phyllostomus discolor]|uniref:Uncharacterized protein n=1 Tax=Phyllostomus discolor TaxID=89673 RepID=A0A834BKU8_9CHIR|nr:hypothetical protein HJG60_007762 [Phyllostomus discolor]